MSWLIRILFSCAGFIAGWFVARDDEIRYMIMELVVILMGMLVLAVVVLYFPAIRGFVRNLLSKRDQAKIKHSAH